MYDHFLAKNWSSYSTTPLQQYTQNFYTLLQNKYTLLPKKTKRLLPIMIKGNWLYNYRTLKGIEKVLIGMNQRTNNKSHMHLAIYDLKRYYTSFEEDFTLFFEELRSFCTTHLSSL